MENLKKIINDCCQTSNESGWWDEYERIIETKKTAKSYGIHELVDFWEIMRLNWLAAQLALIHSEVSEWESAFDEDNFAEELADICIRVFDLIGGLEIDIFNEQMEYNSWCISDKSIHWHISKVLECLRRDQKLGFENALYSVYLKCDAVAKAYGVNLEVAIKKKMEYNKTRPYKHGGKKL